MPDLLEGGLESNVLTLLCWSEKDFMTIRAKIDADMFSLTAFKTIARRAIEFIDRFNKPPQDHLYDLLEVELRQGDSSLIDRFLKEAANNYQRLNPAYVVDMLNRFLRVSAIQSAIEKAHEALTDDNLDGAESALIGLEAKSSLTNPGTFLDDTERVRGFIWPSNEEQDADTFSCGVDVLDRTGSGIKRKTMTLLIGLPNAGKTFWLVNIGKNNCLRGHKVLHVTLEMPEEDIVRRYVRAFFALSEKKSEEIQLPVLKTDDLGRLTSLDFAEAYVPKEIREVSKAQLDLFSRRPAVFVLECPTSSLTVAGLKSQLDLLDKVRSFQPDIVMIDYPDLMALDPRNMRQDMGRVFKEIRGLAMERRFALVVPTQAHRSAGGAKLVTRYHVSEDFSKIMTSDNVYTITRTPGESELNLARIYQDKMRYGQAGYIAAITQAYHIGQFCTGSVLSSKRYMAEVERLAPAEELDKPEEE
jgi:replicative DNA helicase